MRQQTTPHILMVRPANFAFNEETAANNAFQSRDGKLSASEMRERAMKEFDPSKLAPSSKGKSGK